MMSYLRKPPSKRLFCGSRRWKGKDETLPRCCLWLQPPDVSPSLDHPYPHHPVHHLITCPSSLRYSWQFPQGRRYLCPCTLASTWEDPGRQHCRVVPTGVSAPIPRAGCKVRNPARPPHAASSNHPSRQLPAACVAFVTPPGLPCLLPCHITACV